jgi:5-methylcytosine-specific restriction endonuclease McrA
MKVRICTTCGVEKSIEEFPWKNSKKGTRHAVCKSCTAVRSNKWYYANKEHHVRNVMSHKLVSRQKLKDYVNDYLSTHPCVVCGETDPVVLEFDHIRDKDTTIAYLISLDAPLSRLQAEIEKCQVLCVNCHKRKTAQERGWYRCRELPGIYLTHRIEPIDRIELWAELWCSSLTERIGPEASYSIKEKK